MRNKFSTKWKGSKQPRKQRKYIHNSPLHVRRKMLSCNLEKELRKKHEIRNIEIRKGDEVIVLVGEFKKRKGKVLEVDTKNSRVSIEGIQRSKREGSKALVWFNPSNLKIVSLNLDDKKRIIKRKEKINENQNIKGEKKNAPKKK
jgi:large subunit ribosomal protein L24